MKRKLTSIIIILLYASQVLSQITIEEGYVRDTLVNIENYYSNNSEYIQIKNYLSLMSKTIYLIVIL